jgi:hypothetical protein
MSRSKQATQIPMFPGLPHFWSRAAKMPIIPPTHTIPHLVAKKFFILICLSFWTDARFENMYRKACMNLKWAIAQKKTDNPMIFSNTKRYYILRNVILLIMNALLQALASDLTFR